MLFKTGLFFHLIGFFLIAGGNIGSFITESVFWKNVRLGSAKAKEIAPMLMLFPKIIIGGAMMMLASGVLMLYSVNWLFWGQPWLTLKLILFLLLILNGRLAGKPLFTKLAMEVALPQTQTEKLLSLKADTTRFHMSQYFMLLSIIALVIFGK